MRRNTLRANVVWWKILVALACAAVLLQPAVWPAAAALPVASFSLPGNQPAAVTAKLQPVGSPDLSQRVTLAIGLKLPNPKALQASVAAIKSGRVAALTPQQFLNGYAPTAGDYQAVVSWLTGQGFSVQTSPNRLLVLATGSRGQAANAFKASLADYSLDGRTYYANTTAPQIPIALSGIIQSVAGLDNIDYFQTFSHKARAAERPLTAGAPLVASAVYQDVYGITPLGIRTAYDVEPVIESGVNGAGQTIDVAIWNSIDPQDIAQFDSNYGLPATTAGQVNQIVNQIGVGGVPGTDYSTASSGSSEATLDVEMAHAIAPGARIDVYEGVDDDYSTLEETVNETIVQHNSNVLSMGWGSPENSNDPAYKSLPTAFLATFDAIFAQGAAEGMTMLAASGDSGKWSLNDLDSTNSTYSANPALTVDYPASDPYVTGVGGTDLSITPDGAYNGEAVWNDMLGYGKNSGTPYGSTGGFSLDFLAPSWQDANVDNYSYQGINYNPDNSGYSRGVPDVALNASEDMATYIDGAGSTYGGTSIGAPCWAGMVALIDQALDAKGQPSLGDFNPLLYQTGNSSSASSLFHQIIAGDNDTLSASPSPYYAAPGWNPATGWGTPDFKQLFNYLTGASPPAPAASITANPTALAPDYAAGTVITISGVNTHFDSSTTVSLLADKEYAGSPSVTSATSLTFRLAAGLPQGEGNIEVSDTTDGSLTASINIGSETATISPNALNEGYPDTRINITGDNSDFTENALQDEHVVAQVVYAANQEPAINLDVYQAVYAVDAAVTDTTHAYFTLPAGLVAGQYDVVVNDTTAGVSLRIPLTINPPGALALVATATPLPDGAVGLAYTSQAITTYVTASGGARPYSFNVTGLPAGLSFNNSNNEITGVPTAAFSDKVTVTVTDNTTPTAQTASVALPLTVNSSGGGSTPSGGPSGGNGGGGGGGGIISPTVQTNDASFVETNSATLNGNITIGSANITAYGFLWGTSQDSLSNTLRVGTDNHSGTFSATLGSLTTGTAYYFQAYAKNASGTADGTVISFTTTASQTPVTPTPVTFSDVQVSGWVYDAVSNLSRLGYITGYPDGTFKPSGTITRAEFVSMIDRTLKLPAYNPAAPDFSDVSTSDWFYASVENAVYAGDVKGYGNSAFKPDDPITREELANILVNALGKQGEARASMSVRTGFKDDARISSWARGSVAVAVKYGLFKGYPDGSFRPLGDATRAEACAMVWNYLGLNR
jgi:kumamolisin